MYNRGDLSYLQQPKYLSEKTIDKLADRIRTYCLSANQHTFQIILHGGEPLLMPQALFKYFFERFTSCLTGITHLQFFIQTNGILLNKDWLNLFDKYEVSIGISLDGDKSTNDTYRLTHSGRGSFDLVMKGINECVRYPYSFGILGVIDIASDPVEQYYFYKSLQSRQIDFLFPHYHHDNPPIQSEKYADWWIRLFDEWFFDNDESKPNIRFLTQVILNCIGLGEGFDMLGQETNDYLVIETDGSIEAVDALKICGDSFTKENYHITHHSFEEAIKSPLMSLYHKSHQQLAEQCQKCQIVAVCGGGFLPHRYSKEKAFDNPSVYCSELQKIIIHIQHTIIEQLSPTTLQNSGILKYEMAS